MLRPTTPLSALLLAAFVLLLLSVLSVPVTKFVPLGKFKDVTFGVFGFCRDSGQCSFIGLGYDTESLLDNDNKAFDLPISVRNTVSAILVVHLVAAFLALAMFIMTLVAHLHAPGHSARYLLALFIFLLITLLVSLLAFIVDVLLFIPHMAWGSYTVLAATILLAVSVVASCIMRRTLVSRKSRKQRVAENAEMSGENYYNREAQSKHPITVAAQPTMPVISGGNPAAGSGFASFENRGKEDQVSDERAPLTQRSTSERLPNDAAHAGQVAAFNSPMRSPSRDQYGNPLHGPPDAYGSRRGRGDMSPPGGYRGRGSGYGRGSFDNYGSPMRGRGGYYGPAGRGSPRGGRLGYGPSPRGGYGARGGRGPPPSYGNAPPGPYDRRPPANALYDGQKQPETGWNAGGNNATMPNLGNGYAPYNPDNDLPRAESPPPLPGAETAKGVAQAIEMDATTTPARTFGQYGQIRDSDVDVVGMVGLQQGRPPARHDTIMSDRSKYSTDEVYVPPRVAWNQSSGPSTPRDAPPSNTLPPAAELSGQGNNYYEDVLPRFAGQARSNNNPPALAEAEYEDVHATTGGALSPAESERSNLTSISQRGVNPRWNPNAAPMPGYHQGVPPRRAVQQQQIRQDMLLDNPDFQLPGGRPKGAHRGGPGMIPGSAYPTNRI